jgi:hypothetical protein
MAIYYQRFGTTCQSHLLRSNSVLEMGTIGCPETSVRSYHYWLHKFPTDRSSYEHRGESLESSNLYIPFIGFPFSWSFHYGLWSHFYGIIAFCITFVTSRNPFIFQRSSSSINVHHFVPFLSYCKLQATGNSVLTGHRQPDALTACGSYVV